MIKRDYYEILGVNKNASKEEIEQAYRRLAVQYHPDRVQPEKKEEAREKFKEVSEAYAVLSDPVKRKQYDQFGHAGIDGRYSPEDIYRNVNFGSIFEDLGFGTESIFEDIFDFFGARTSRKHGPRRGTDIEYSLTISLEEAYKGVEKEIEFYHTQHCSVCGGTGQKPGTGKKICPQCRGSGKSTSSFGGFFTFTQPCSKCHGSGELIEVPCPECHGRGKVPKREKLVVKIPRGIDTNNQIRLRGKGEAGEYGGSPGDLYIYVKITEHPLFKREGNDLYLEQKIPFSTACLGGEVTVNTFDGPIKMKISPGIQCNKILRVKDKGMPNLHSNRKGDLYVKIIIDVPTKLNERQKNLLREFDKLYNI